MSSGSQSPQGSDPADSRDQFSRVAEAYRTSTTHSDPVSLARFIDLADLKPNHRVLDIATGAGHVAVAAAPMVKEVVALDITAVMLDQARQLAASRESRNISFVLADAEALPFTSESFDRVLVRSAPHHFRNLIPALAEAYRVLVPGGAFAISDCSPPPVVRDWLEVVEAGRDRSHFRSRALEEWRALLQSMGFTVEQAERIEQEKDILEWFDRSGVTPRDRRRLLDYYETAPAAVAGQLTPQWREGRFYHRYWYALIRARRPLHPLG
ncbi:MAG TPA: methyltransferase domain-containing protein [Candidatus Dormibacteraeota bacterium]|nr:methyltransferase domain-containing protein [Candidatus Dormibacteraeota bacterium]